jgi:hypothetical protein
MPRTCKTPAGTGASRDSCSGRSHAFSTLEVWQTQFPILVTHCGPEWLAMMVAVLMQGGGR